MEGLEEAESRGKRWCQRTAAALLVIGAVLLLLASTQPLWQAHASSPLIPQVDITVSLRFWDVSYVYPGSQSSEPISSLSAEQQGALQLYLAAMLVTASLAFLAAASALVRYRRIGIASAGLAMVMGWTGPLAFTHYLPIAINAEPVIPFLTYQFGFYGSYEGLFAKVDYGSGLGWTMSLIAAALLSGGALLLWRATRAKLTNAFK